MTQRSGQLHLNAFLLDVGHHEASWRLPESDPYAGSDVEHFKQLARLRDNYGLRRPARGSQLQLPAARPSERAQTAEA